MAQIDLSEVSMTFRRGRKQEFSALGDVTFSVEDGELIAIVGPSGCGKTTLLNVVAGLLEPSSGQILLDGRPVKGPGRDRGVVFQQDTLFLWRTVVRNVEYGLETRGIPKQARRERALHWLGIVGLERFADFFPKELSGGMKKRCQIAAVLANEPEVLLMDEPYGALDYPTKCQLQAELLRILGDAPKTTLFVTHDIEEALFLADRIVLMGGGEVKQIYTVPFVKPRSSSLRLTVDFASAKSELWSYIGGTEESALSSPVKVESSASQ
jgi:NitT/TauT family transport system ATP-binding protein